MKDSLNVACTHINAVFYGKFNRSVSTFLLLTHDLWVLNDVNVVALFMDRSIAIDHTCFIKDFKLNLFFELECRFLFI